MILKVVKQDPLPRFAYLRSKIEKEKFEINI